MNNEDTWVNIPVQVVGFSKPKENSTKENANEDN